MTGEAPAPAQRSPGLLGGVRLATVGGVPVRMHWTAVVIMALVAWSLAGVTLPDGYPDRSTWAYAVAGTLAAAVFLLGLLAHEGAHAVVARRNGVQVRSITLWMLGGVAELDGEARRPGAELRIAGSGPLVSLLLGGAFAALAAVCAAAGVTGLPVGALRWLASLNLLLALFNVLPGAPLDGGRLLRAALWQWRGDRQWATVTAAAAGRALGLVLITLGVLDFFLGGNGGGLWIALVGWFIVGAAGAEERTARLSGSLAGIRVGQVMTPAPDTVAPGVTVAEFIEHYLFTHRHSTFPVVADTRPIGLVTLARVRQVDPAARAYTTLGQVASPLREVPVAAPDEPLADVLPRMRVSDGRVLVLADGALVGILSPADVTRVVDAAALRSAVS